MSTEVDLKSLVDEAVAVAMPKMLQRRQKGPRRQKMPKRIFRPVNG